MNDPIGENGLVASPSLAGIISLLPIINNKFPKQKEPLEATKMAYGGMKSIKAEPGVQIALYIIILTTAD